MHNLMMTAAKEHIQSVRMGLHSLTLPHSSSTHSKGNILYLFVFSHLLFVLSQLAEDELDGSDRELDMEEGTDLSELQWGGPSPPQTSSRPASSTSTFTCTDLAGRDTPASLDSIPLEWDHDYDLSRGLDSPGGRGQRERSKEQEEEDEYLRTATAVLSGQYM